jgi:hypothetical protein
VSKYVTELLFILFHGLHAINSVVFSWGGIVIAYQLLSMFLPDFIGNVRALIVFGMVDAILIMYSIDSVIVERVRWL